MECCRASEMDSRSRRKSWSPMKASKPFLESTTFSNNRFRTLPQSRGRQKRRRRRCQGSFSSDRTTTEPRSSKTSTSTSTSSGFVQFRPNFDFPQNSLVDGKVWQQRQNIFIDFVEDMSSTEPLFNSPTTQFIDLSSLNQFDVFQRASEIVSQVQVN